MRVFNLFATSIMLCSSAAYAAEQIAYTVKVGDTLSTIAQKKIGMPIFKKGGSLSKLLSMNPGIHDVDLIFPGQTLVIRSGKLQSLAEVESTEVENSIFQAQSRQLASNESPVEKAIVCQEPTQKIVAEDLEKIEIPHHLILEASVGMTTLSSVDAVTNADANLYSSQDLTLQAGWQQNWTDSFSTKLAAKFRSVDFQPPASSTKFISNSKKLTTGLSLGAESKLTPKFTLSYDVSYNQEFILRGLTSTSVAVDLVAIPKLSLGGNYQVYSVGRTSLGLTAGFDYLMKTAADGYTVNSGTALQGGFFIKRRYDIDRSVEIHINYRDRAQNTSQVSLHEKTVSATLGFSLPLFNEDVGK